MLDLMYITNKPDIALIAQNAGVNRIFVDMEYIGKYERQGGMDTVQNHHTVKDVENLRKVLNKSQLLVRVNPIHKNSENEINAVLEAGADIIMLPMWHTAEDVEKFIHFIGGRAKTMLLLENADAVKNLDKVLKLGGIDEIHIGLNDLHLSLGRHFLFELLADSTVEEITKKIKSAGIRFGFGGFGRIGEGLLPAEYIVAEHYRLGSSIAILSRSFCDLSKTNDLKVIDDVFQSGMKKLRDYEFYLQGCDRDFLNETHLKLQSRVNYIVREIKNV